MPLPTTTSQHSPSPSSRSSSSHHLSLLLPTHLPPPYTSSSHHLLSTHLSALSPPLPLPSYTDSIPYPLTSPSFFFSAALSPLPSWASTWRSFIFRRRLSNSLSCSSEALACCPMSDYSSKQRGHSVMEASQRTEGTQCNGGISVNNCAVALHQYSGYRSTQTTLHHDTIAKALAKCLQLGKLRKCVTHFGSL